MISSMEQAFDRGRPILQPPTELEMARFIVDNKSNRARVVAYITEIWRAIPGRNGEQRPKSPSPKLLERFISFRIHPDRHTSDSAADRALYDAAMRAIRPILSSGSANNPVARPGPATSGVNSGASRGWGGRRTVDVVNETILNAMAAARSCDYEGLIEAFNKFPTLEDPEGIFRVRLEQFVLDLRSRLSEELGMMCSSFAQFASFGYGPYFDDQGLARANFRFFAQLQKTDNSQLQELFRIVAFDVKHHHSAIVKQMAMEASPRMLREVVELLGIKDDLVLTGLLFNLCENSVKLIEDRYAHKERDLAAGIALALLSTYREQVLAAAGGTGTFNASARQWLEITPFLRKLVEKPAIRGAVTFIGNTLLGKEGADRPAIEAMIQWVNKPFGTS